jgi:hypothetical protein
MTTTEITISHGSELDMHGWRAIWSVQLTGDEIKALKTGVLPDQIRPDKLIAWWPQGGCLTTDTLEAENNALRKQIYDAGLVPEPDAVAGGSSASSQGSPRNRHEVPADSVIVPAEASDASPVRANTQSRTFTITG